MMMMIYFWMFLRHFDDLLWMWLESQGNYQFGFAPNLITYIHFLIPVNLSNMNLVFRSEGLHLFCENYCAFIPDFCTQQNARSGKNSNQDRFLIINWCALFVQISLRSRVLWIQFVTDFLVTFTGEWLRLISIIYCVHELKFEITFQINNDHL